MTSAALLVALALFNSSVAEFRAQTTPDARVFVGAQVMPYVEGQGLAWTKCVPESGVFVTQVTDRLLEGDPALIRHAAAHEIAHVLLHASLLCSPEMRFSDLPKARQMEIELEAEARAEEMTR